MLEEWLTGQGVEKVARGADVYGVTNFKHGGGDLARKDKRILDVQSETEKNNWKAVLSKAICLNSTPEGKEEATRLSGGEI